MARPERLPPRNPDLADPPGLAAASRQRRTQGRASRAAQVYLEFVERRRRARRRRGGPRARSGLTTGALPTGPKVLLIPRPADLDALQMVETVVVGYDGHEHSTRVLERAIEVVKMDGGRLIVVVVEELPPPQHAPTTGFGSYDSGLYELGTPSSFLDLEHPLPGVQDIIDQARERLGEAGVSAECTWGVGDPAQVIVDAARHHGASKILVGAHHHGFFGRLFGEDVAAEIQHVAQCEVVLID